MSILSLDSSFLFLAILLNGFYILIITNPIHAILYLILLFCNAGFLLIFLGCDFLGLLFIIIYVGAIAILFLFIIMLLNIKYKLNSSIYFGFLSFVFIICSFSELFLQQNFLFDLNFISNNVLIHYDQFTQVEILGQILYNYYSFCLLILGLMLVLPLLGTCILTLNFQLFSFNEYFIRQTCRIPETIAFAN